MPKKRRKRGTSIKDQNVNLNVMKEQCEVSIENDDLKRQEFPLKNIEDSCLSSLNSSPILTRRSARLKNKESDALNLPKGNIIQDLTIDEKATTSSSTIKDDHKSSINESPNILKQKSLKGNNSSSYLKIATNDQDSENDKNFDPISNREDSHFETIEIVATNSPDLINLNSEESKKIDNACVQLKNKADLPKRIEDTSDLHVAKTNINSTQQTVDTIGETSVADITINKVSMTQSIELSKETARRTKGSLLETNSTEIFQSDNNFDAPIVHQTGAESIDLEQQTAALSSNVNKVSLISNESKNIVPASTVKSKVPIPNPTKKKKFVGLSFILTVKKPCTSENSLISTYDCIVCNTNKPLSYQQKTIKTHLVSRKHVLNVMEIENSEMFETVKENMSTCKITEKLMNYESGLSDQCIISVTRQNYVKVRKQMQQEILEKKNLVKKKQIFNQNSPSIIKEESMNDPFNKKTVLLVGDNQAKNLFPKLKVNSNKLLSYSDCSDLRSIVNLVDNFLQNLPSSSDCIIVIIGFNSELLNFELKNNKKTLTVKDADIDYILKLVSDNTFRWKDSHPHVTVMWTIPSVPNFLRFNVKQHLTQGTESLPTQKVYIYSASDTEETLNVKKFFKLICTIKDNWKKFMDFPEFVYLDLLSCFYSDIVKEGVIKSYSGKGKPAFKSSITKDGYNYSESTQSLFWEAVKSHYDNIFKIEKLDKLYSNKSDYSTAKKDQYPSIQTSKNEELKSNSFLKKISREMEEIVKLHQGRKQNNIVVIHDERHIMLTLDAALQPGSNHGKKLAHKHLRLLKNCSVLYCPNITLENAFKIIKIRLSFTDNTMFVFLCGTNSTVTKYRIPECNKDCPSNGSFFQPKPMRIIKSALNLHLDILKSSKNSSAMFCGLIPIDINKFNLHAFKSCSDIHEASYPKLMTQSDIENYVSDLHSYNCFASHHAVKLGIDYWDIEKRFFDDFNSSCGSWHMLDDRGYLLNDGEMEQKNSMIQTKCDELAYNILQVSSPSTEVHLVEKSLSNYLHGIPKIYEKLVKQIVYDQKKRNPKKIVIVTDNRMDFSTKVHDQDNIEIINCHNTSLNDVLPIIKNHRTFNQGSLYVFHMGIFSLLKSVSFTDCCKKKCPVRAKYYTIDQYYSEDLLKMTLKLHGKILNSTTNDAAVFCSLIPIDIQQYNKYLAINRSCYNNHSVLNYLNPSKFLRQEYLIEVVKYNEFIKIYDSNLGIDCPDLHMDSQFFNDNCIIKNLHYNGLNPQQNLEKTLSKNLKMACFQLSIKLSSKNDCKQSPSFLRKSYHKNLAAYKKDTSTKKSPLTDSSRETSTNASKKIQDVNDEQNANNWCVQNELKEVSCLQMNEFHVIDSVDCNTSDEEDNLSNSTTKHDKNTPSDISKDDKDNLSDIGKDDKDNLSDIGKDDKDNLSDIGKDDKDNLSELKEVSCLQMKEFHVIDSVDCNTNDSSDSHSSERHDIKSFHQVKSSCKPNLQESEMDNTVKSNKETTFSLLGNNSKLYDISYEMETNFSSSNINASSVTTLVDYDFAKGIESSLMFSDIVQHHKKFDNLVENITTKNVNVSNIDKNKNFSDVIKVDKDMKNVFDSRCKENDNVTTKTNIDSDIIAGSSTEAKASGSCISNEKNTRYSDISLQEDSEFEIVPNRKSNYSTRKQTRSWTQSKARRKAVVLKKKLRSEDTRQSKINNEEKKKLHIIGEEDKVILNISNETKNNISDISNDENIFNIIKEEKDVFSISNHKDSTSVIINTENMQLSAISKDEKNNVSDTSKEKIDVIFDITKNEKNNVFNISKYKRDNLSNSTENDKNNLTDIISKDDKDNLSDISKDEKDNLSLSLSHLSDIGKDEKDNLCDSTRTKNDTNNLSDISKDEKDNLSLSMSHSHLSDIGKDEKDNFSDINKNDNLADIGTDEKDNLSDISKDEKDNLSEISKDEKDNLSDISKDEKDSLSLSLSLSHFSNIGKDEKDNLSDSTGTKNDKNNLSDIGKDEKDTLSDSNKNYNLADMGKDEKDNLSDINKNDNLADIGNDEKDNLSEISKDEKDNLSDISKDERDSLSLSLSLSHFSNIGKDKKDNLSDSTGTKNDKNNLSDIGKDEKDTLSDSNKNYNLADMGKDEKDNLSDISKNDNLADIGNDEKDNLSEISKDEKDNLSDISKDEKDNFSEINKDEKDNLSDISKDERDSLSLSLSLSHFSNIGKDEKDNLSDSTGTKNDKNNISDIGKDEKDTLSDSNKNYNLADIGKDEKDNLSDINKNDNLADIGNDEKDNLSDISKDEKDNLSEINKDEKDNLSDISKDERDSLSLSLSLSHFSNIGKDEKYNLSDSTGTKNDKNNLSDIGKDEKDTLSDRNKNYNLADIGKDEKDNLSDINKNDNLADIGKDEKDNLSEISKDEKDNLSDISKDERDSLSLSLSLSHFSNIGKDEKDNLSDSTGTKNDKNNISDIIKDEKNNLSDISNDEKDNLSDISNDEKDNLSDISKDEKDNLSLSLSLSHLSDISKDEKDNLSDISKDEEDNLFDIIKDKKGNLSDISKDEKDNLSDISKDEKDNLSDISKDEEDNLSEISIDEKDELSDISNDLKDNIREQKDCLSDISGDEKDILSEVIKDEKKNLSDVSNKEEDIVADSKRGMKIKLSNMDENNKNNYSEICNQGKGFASAHSDIHNEELSVSCSGNVFTNKDVLQADSIVVDASEALKTCSSSKVEETESTISNSTENKESTGTGNYSDAGNVMSTSSFHATAVNKVDIESVKSSKDKKSAFIDHNMQKQDEKHIVKVENKETKKSLGSLNKKKLLNENKADSDDFCIDIEIFAPNDDIDLLCCSRGSKEETKKLEEKSKSCIVQKHQSDSIPKSKKELHKSSNRSSLEKNSSRVDGTSSRVDGTSSRVDGTSFRVDGTSSRVDGTSSRVDGISSRLDRSSSRLDRSSSRLDRSSSRLDRSRNWEDGTSSKVDKNCSRVDKIESYSYIKKAKLSTNHSVIDSTVITDKHDEKPFKAVCKDTTVPVNTSQEKIKQDVKMVSELKVSTPIDALLINTETEATKHKVVEDLVDKKILDKILTNPPESKPLVEKKYNKIIIVSEKGMKPFLKHLQTENVVVMANENFADVSSYRSFMLRKKKLFKGLILFIIVPGINMICSSEENISCKQTPSCKSILECYVLKPEIKNQISKNLAYLSAVFKCLAASFLVNPNINVAFFPPMPVSLLYSKVVAHDTLHQVMNRHPNYLLTREKNVLTNVYASFFKAFKCLSLDALESASSLAHRIVKPHILSFDSWKMVLMSTVNSLSSNNIQLPLYPTYSVYQKFDKLVICAPERFFNEFNSVKSSLSSMKIDVTMTSWSIFDDRCLFLEEMKKFQALQKTCLFLVVTDIELISIKEVNSDCTTKSCPVPLQIFKRLDNFGEKLPQKLDKIMEVINNIEKLLPKSKVLLAPLIPRFCQLQPCLSSDVHSDLHTHFEDGLLYLEGNQEWWTDSSAKLLSVWNEMLDNILTPDIYHAIQNSLFHCDPILIWTHLQTFDNSKWWQNNIQLIVKELVKESEFDFSVGHETSMNTHPLRGPTNAAQSQVYKRKRYETNEVGTCLTSKYNQSNKIPKNINNFETLHYSKAPYCEAPSAFNVVHSQTNFSPQNSSVDFVDKRTLVNIKPVMSVPLPMRNFNPTSLIQVPPTAMIPVPPTAMIPVPPTAMIPMPSSSVPPLLRPPVRTEPRPIYAEQYHHDNSKVTHQVVSSAKVSQSPARVNIVPPVIQTSRSINLSRPSNDKLSKNSDTPSKLLSQDILNSFAKKDVFKQYKNLEKNVCQLKDLLTYEKEPLYSQVYILGKKSLVEPLKRLNIKSIIIPYNLSNLSDSDIPILLRKLKPLDNQAICCLVFDVSIITEPQLFSLGCSKFGCKDNITSQMVNLQSEKLIDINHKIQKVLAVTKKLCETLPVVILPLYPTQIYCDKLSSLKVHRQSHLFKNKNATIVSGEEFQWKSAIKILESIWRNVLMINHENFETISCLTKYFEVLPHYFSICKSFDDVEANWIDGSVWMALSELLLQSFVPQKASSILEISHKESSLNEKVTVHINHVFSTLPKSYYIELMKFLDDRASVKEAMDGTIVIRNMNKYQGLLLAIKLDKYQVADTFIETRIKEQDKEEHYLLSELQKLYMSTLLSHVFNLKKQDIVDKIIQKIDSVPNLTNLKTVKCTMETNCPGVKRCRFFHNKNDIRRDPTAYNYSDRLCFNKITEDGYCKEKEIHCDRSHNIYEMKFHPIKYQKLECCSKLPSELCNALEFCKYAHTAFGSWDGFFNKSWQDLAVFGTHQSIEYLAGAIRVSNKVSNVKIVMISQSVDLLNVAARSISNLACLFQLLVGPVNCNQNEVLASAQVLLRTPSSISTVSASFLTGHNSAIIIDNADEIVTKEDDLIAVKDFIKSIPVSSEYCSNKVFACKKYGLNVTNKLSEYFKLNLKEISPTIELVKSSDEEMKMDTTNNKISTEVQPNRPIKKNIEGENSLHQSKWEPSDQLSKSKPSDHLSKFCYNEDASRSLNKKTNIASTGSVLDTHDRRQKRSRSRNSNNEAIESKEKLLKRSRSPGRNIREENRKKNYELKTKDCSKQTCSGSRNVSSTIKERHSRSNKRPHSPCKEGNLLQGSEEIHASKRMNTYRKPKEDEIFLQVKSVSKSQLPVKDLSLAGESSKEKYDPFKEAQEYEANQRLQYSNQSVVAKTQPIHLDLRNQLGQKLYEQYIQEAAQLRKSIDEEYKVFQEMPEFHPDFLKHYEDFMQSSRKKHGEVDIVTREKLWSTHWNFICEDVKNQDFQKQEKQLVKKLQPKASINAPVPSSNSNESSLKVSLNETFNHLDALCSDIGVLGPALKEMIKQSRNIGIDSQKTLDMFKDPENVIFINILLGKFENLKNSSSPSKSVRVNAAMKGLSDLLRYAQEGFSTKHEGLNIETIAKASFGETPAFTLNLIRTALVYEGIEDPSSEQVNKIFLDVCSKHFELQMIPNS